MFTAKIAQIGVTQVNRFAYSGTTANRYEQAVIDTVKFLGFMSLKNSDHSVAGANAAANKRILKEAVETRKAADSLLASGAVVLLGTWSNGIAVGPGVGFERIDHSMSVAPAAKRARKSKSAGMMVEWTDGTLISWTATARRFPNLVKAGTTCEMRYADGASCEWQSATNVMHGPAYVAPTGFPPGVRCDDQQSGTEIWHWYCDELRAIAVQYDVQPATDAPTPIYAPAVGDTVFVIYRHENGTTTDRVINVQRVGNGVFRGNDRRYGRVRNFYADHVAVIRKWDGTAIMDHNGNIAVAAA